MGVSTRPRCLSVGAPQPVSSGMLPGRVPAPWGEAPPSQLTTVRLSGALWLPLGHVLLKEAAGPAWASALWSSVVMLMVLMAEISALYLYSYDLPEVSVQSYYLVPLSSRDLPRIYNLNLEMCHHTLIMTLDTLC